MALESHQQNEPVAQLGARTSHGRRQASVSAIATQTSPVWQTTPPTPPHLQTPSAGSQEVPFVQVVVQPLPPWQTGGGPSWQSWVDEQTGPPAPPHLHWPSAGSQVVPLVQVTAVQAELAEHVFALSAHVGEPAGQRQISPLWQMRPLHRQ